MDPATLAAQAAATQSTVVLAQYGALGIMALVSFACAGYLVYYMLKKGAEAQKRCEIQDHERQLEIKQLRADFESKGRIDSDRLHQSIQNLTDISRAVLRTVAEQSETTALVRKQKPLTSPPSSAG